MNSGNHILHALADDFITEWFGNPSWWFNAPPDVDAYLTDKYEALLLSKAYPKLIQSVVIHDQLTRHIVRHYKYYNKEYYIRVHLDWALDALKMEGYDVYEALRKTPEHSWQEWTFLMMPYRHDNNIGVIEWLVQYIWHNLNLKNGGNDQKVLKRFLKATYMTIHDKTFGLEYYSNNLRLNGLLQYTPIPFPHDIKFNQSHYLISLSGGVDSMVCSAILNDSRCLGAVFINYNNRPESPQELAFVKEWCAKIGLPLWVKTINEINRPQCMAHNLRELYESYTKQVRFGCYKRAWNEALGQVGAGTNSPPVIVMGHHQGDQIENCMTNILAGTKFNDLLGMNEERLIDNVLFVRPLLGIDKKHIIEFAEDHHIPYLPDSTVSWSARGKIRDNVLPGIDKWCGIDKMATALVHHAAMCQEAIDIVGMFAREFKGKMDSRTPLTPGQIPDTAMFYRKLLQLYLLFPSNKAINQLTTAVIRFKTGAGGKKTRTVELMKNVQLMLKKIADDKIIMWI